MIHKTKTSNDSGYIREEKKIHIKFTSFQVMTQS